MDKKVINDINNLLINKKNKELKIEKINNKVSNIYGTGFLRDFNFHKKILPFIVANSFVLFVISGVGLLVADNSAQVFTSFTLINFILTHFIVSIVFKKKRILENNFNNEINVIKKSIDIITKEIELHYENNDFSSYKNKSKSFYKELTENEIFVLMDYKEYLKHKKNKHILQPQILEITKFFSNEEDDQNEEEHFSVNKIENI